MKPNEFAKLHEHFTRANILVERIAGLKKMIVGIERRLGDGSRDLRMYVHASEPRHGRYDRGVDVTLPEAILRDAILPALKDQLEKLRKEFQDTPARQE